MRNGRPSASRGGTGAAVAVAAVAVRRGRVQHPQREKQQVERLQERLLLGGVQGGPLEGDHRGHSVTLCAYSTRGSTMAGGLGPEVATSCSRAPARTWCASCLLHHDASKDVSGMGLSAGR